MSAEQIYNTATLLIPIFEDEKEESEKVKFYIERIVSKYGDDTALKLTSGLETLYGLQALSLFLGIDVRESDELFRMRHLELVRDRVQEVLGGEPKN